MQNCKHALAPSCTCTRYYMKPAKCIKVTPVLHSLVKKKKLHEKMLFEENVKLSVTLKEQ